MVYILSVNMSSSEKMWVFRVINCYWWPIRVKSNLILGFQYWREYVAYPILLNCAENKGSIFGVAFGRLFSFLPNELTWVCILSTGYVIFLVKSVVGTLSHFISALSILEIICESKPPNIRMIYDAKKRWVKNPYGGFFTFVKLICMAWNVLGVFSMSSLV